MALILLDQPSISAVKAFVAQLAGLPISKIIVTGRQAHEIDITLVIDDNDSDPFGTLVSIGNAISPTLAETNFWVSPLPIVASTWGACEAMRDTAERCRGVDFSHLLNCAA